MKRFITVILCILGLILIVICTHQESNKEILFYGNLEKEHCETFYIPEIDEINNPERLFQILSATADETSSNIIKTSLIDGESNGSYELIKYVLIKSDNSSYLKSFKLKSGESLSSVDTVDPASRKYLSSKSTGDKNQIGKINSFMINSEVSVYPLNTLFDYVKANGLYYVELAGEVTTDEFINALKDNIQHFSGIEVDINELIGSESTVRIPYNDLTQYYIAFLFVFLLFILLVFYYLLKKRRDTAIMKLMGVKGMSIWKSFFVEPLIGYPLFSIICMAYLQIIHHDFNYSIQMMRYALCFYPVIIVFFLLAYHISNGELAFSVALKGKDFTTGILALQVIAELLCALFVLYSGAGVYTEAKQLLQDIKKYENWAIAENYGVFYPFYIGDDQTSQEEIERETIIGNELYHYLNDKGALFINSIEFEDEYLELNAATIANRYEQSMKLNPNYLQEYNIYDENGNRITVNENENDLILLVPEAEKKNEDEILRFYQQEQLYYRELDEDYYGISHTDLQQQKPSIIWTQNNQKVFTFDASVNTGIEGIEDPVIVVLTENNSYTCQRIGILGKGNSDPLKVRLNGSSRETYETIYEALSQMGLADNLKALVSINEQAQESLTIIRANLMLSIRLLLLLILLVIYLAYQTTYLLFEKNKKTYVVMHMFGLHQTTIYGKQCLIITSMLLVLAAFYAVIIKYGGWIYAVLAMCVIVIVHLLVMHICITRQLKAKRSDVLKGV